MNTTEQILSIIEGCKTLFKDKTADYGTSWRILRPSSVTDQINIKALRIRSIQEKGGQKVGDDIEGEFVGIINYCVMAIIQLRLRDDKRLNLPLAECLSLYEAVIEENMRLLSDKNHDYGEAWRLMRVSSITDIILMKLLRIKQIEDNDGNTRVSEGIESGYRDIINYACFSLILMRAPSF